ITQVATCESCHAYVAAAVNGNEVCKEVKSSGQSAVGPQRRAGVRIRDNYTGSEYAVRPATRDEYVATAVQCQRTSSSAVAPIGPERHAALGVGGGRAEHQQNDGRERGEQEDRCSVSTL